MILLEVCINFPLESWTWEQEACTSSIRTSREVVGRIGLDIALVVPWQIVFDSSHLAVYLDTSKIPCKLS